MKQGEIIFGDFPSRSASLGVFALRAAASALSEAPRLHSVGLLVTEKGISVIRHGDVLYLFSSFPSAFLWE
ncbi:MAG: hypothetical protein MJ070_11260, partial [Lachnospiraceae bacterium]|nr:hypothetical protein [Lachnospiraceae bacterium]